MSGIRSKMPKGLYWWHIATLRDLRRLHDECGMTSYSVEGLADNREAHTTPLDMRRYLLTLSDLGLVEKAEPSFEFESLYPWYRLTQAGRELLDTLREPGAER